MASTMFFKPGLRPCAKVYLRDIHDRETIFLRTISLTTPTFEIKIGRGSQTEPQLHPQAMNAWFTSRVMSREHAVLYVDQSKKEVLLADAKSMHGTFLDGKRLEQGEKAVVTQGQRIQFGTEIVRGEQTYKPLELSLQVDWADDVPTWPRTSSFSTASTRNTFSSEYSEEEDDDDDEGEEDVEVVYESIRIPDDAQPKTFSVPESDESESSIMEKNLLEEESPPSSPIDPAKPQSGSTAAPLPVIINVPTMSNPKINNTAKPKEINDIPGSSMDSALDVSDDDDVAPNDIGAGYLHDDVSDSSENDDYAPSCAAEDYEYDNEDEPYSELDDDLDEEENDSVWESMQSNLSPPKVQAHIDNRAPSPSDAAMPKPSWYNSGIVDQLDSQVSYQSLQHPNHLSNSHVQQPMPPYPTYGCYYSTPWTAPNTVNYPEPFPRQTLNGWQNTSVPHRPNDFAPVRPAVYPLALNMQGSMLASNVGLNATKTVDNAVATKNTEVNDVMLKPSKVSINDIIDNVTGESCARKRKADDISTSTSEEERSLESHVSEADDTILAFYEGEDHTVIDSNTHLPDETPNITTVETNPKGTPEKKKTVTFSPDAVIIEPEPVPELERSQKRVKVTHNEGGTFLKYAATAAAGMAIGAIGTVFGLVALPAEYFG